MKGLYKLVSLLAPCVLMLLISVTSCKQNGNSTDASIRLDTISLVPGPMVIEGAEGADTFSIVRGTLVVERDVNDTSFISAYPGGQERRESKVYSVISIQSRNSHNPQDKTSPEVNIAIRRHGTPDFCDISIYGDIVTLYPLDYPLEVRCTAEEFYGLKTSKIEIVDSAMHSIYCSDRSPTCGIVPGTGPYWIKTLCSLPKSQREKNETTTTSTLTFTIPVPLVAKNANGALLVTNHGTAVANVAEGDPCKDEVPYDDVVTLKYSATNYSKVPGASLASMEFKICFRGYDD